MNYAKFYTTVNQNVTDRGNPPRPVTFEFLRALVTQDDSLVKELDVWRIVYNPAIRDARFTLFDERESRHDDPEYCAEISFCSSLESDPSHLLFALTKELMHVFDPMDTWINTRDKFITFLRDLQNTPLEFENGNIRVEHKARWMAVLALCPEVIRDYIKDSVGNKGVLKAEIAQELGLSVSIIEIALDDYYEQALRIMLAS